MTQVLHLSTCDVIYIAAVVCLLQVFPTTKQIWVSLEDHPLIADNRDWEKLFSDKEGVHFLDIEDKSNKASNTARSAAGHRGQRNISKSCPL